MSADTELDEQLQKRIDERVHEKMADLVRTQEITLTRRQALASMLGVAGVGAAGYSWINPAQAQSAVGQIGTETERVDVFANDLDATTAIYGEIEADDDLVVNSLSTESARITGTDDITINVPTDEPTLVDAFIRATQELKPQEGVGITINIETGHDIEAGVSVFDGFFSHITITSEDATVGVSTGFDDTLMFGRRCFMPIWDLVVDMNGQGGSGISTDQCVGKVAENAGVINAGNFGLRVSTGVYDGDDSVFSGATSYGLNASSTAVVRAQRADFSACERGVFASRSSNVNVDEADLSNATEKALVCRRSRVFGGAVDCSNPGDDGISAELGGVAILPNVDVSDARQAIAVNGLSSVWARNATISDPSLSGVFCRRGEVCVTDATISGTGSDGIDIRERGNVIADNVTLSNVGGDGVRLRDFSSGGVTQADFSTITGTPVVVTRACLVGANQATVDTDPLDAGDTNLTNLNEVTSDGIIFG